MSEYRIPQVKLSSIELGLLAELNRQMAHAYAEEADDAHKSPEARHAARVRGARLEARAQMFHEEARRVSDEAALTAEPAVVYTGPERRRGERRRRERRSHKSTQPDGLPAGRDRRINPDRRRHERRRWPGRA